MLTLEEKLTDSFDASLLGYSTIEEMILAWDGEVFITSGDGEERRCYVIFERDRKPTAACYITHDDILKMRPYINRLIPPPIEATTKELDTYDRIISTVIKPRFDEAIDGETITLTNAVDMALAHTLKCYGDCHFSRVPHDPTNEMNLPHNDYFHAFYTVHADDNSRLGISDFFVDARAE